jgi:hypothetical protein
VRPKPGRIQTRRNAGRPHGLGDGLAQQETAGHCCEHEIDRLTVVVDARLVAAGAEAFLVLDSPAPAK